MQFQIPECSLRPRREGDNPEAVTETQQNAR